ncbi:MAG: pitrilysin family protein [Polyangiaceae bacterium]
MGTIAERSSPASEPREVVLASGLRLLLVPQPALHRAVAALFLRVGSRFESARDNGLSHFLEHMVFRGTASLPSAHDQALAFERLGGTLYAATHVDHGVMSVSVPPANLEASLALLGEVTVAPRFTEVEIERGIVREEILEDVDDDGRQIDADNLVRALMYDDHPLGFTITGDAAGLDDFDEARLRGHHQRHYTAENAVLCLAGRLGDGTPDAVAERWRAAAERCFAAMPRGRRIEATPPPGGQGEPRVAVVENQGSQTDLRLAFRAVGELDRREAAVDMLLRVLDDGMSTRLYERVCDRRGLCYDISAMYEAYEDDGVVDVAAGVAHDRAHLVVAEVLDLLRELRDKGPREDELQKARDRHLWSAQSMLDDAESTAGFHGLAAFAGTTRTPEARHQELCAVTAADVREAAEHVFQPRNLSVVAVGLLRASQRAKLKKLVREFE